jgi:hypothetical protein
METIQSHFLGVRQSSKYLTDFQGQIKNHPIALTSVAYTINILQSSNDNRQKLCLYHKHHK